MKNTIKKQNQQKLKEINQWMKNIDDKIRRYEKDITDWKIYI